MLLGANFENIEPLRMQEHSMMNMLVMIFWDKLYHLISLKPIVETVHYIQSEDYCKYFLEKEK